MKAALVWFNKIAALSLSGVSLGIVATGLLIGIVAWSPTPVWDQWDAVTPEQLADLFRPHNEHRIAMSRLIFQADIALGRGAGIISLAFMYLYVAAHFVLLFFLARWTWPNAGRLRLAAAGALAASFFFSGFQYENFVSGFQNQFTGVFLFASVAIAALCVAAARTGRSRKVLILVSITAALVGVASMANGLLIAPLLVIVALLLNLRATAWIMAILSAITWGVYFRGAPPSEEPSALTALLRDPIGFIENVLTYAGGAIPNSLALHADFSPHKLVLARAFGLLAAVVIGALALRTLNKGWQERPKIAAWTAIGLFVFLSAAVTAVGRSDLGDDAMLANRYGAGTAALWAVIAIWAVMKSRSNVLPITLAAALACATVLAITQLQWLRLGETYKVKRLEAEAGLLVNADAFQAYLGVYPSAKRVSDIAGLLRQDELAMYFEPWRRMFGHSIAAAPDLCQSEVGRITPLARASQPTWRASITGELPQGVRAVAVVTPERDVVGILIRGAADDIKSRVFHSNEAPPSWAGYVHLQAPRTAELSLEAMDAAGKSLCRLDKTISVHAYDTLSIARSNTVGEAIKATEAVVSGDFPIDGHNAAVGENPWGGTSWGSWAGDDRKTGRLVLRANVDGLDRIAIPLVTGPTPDATRLKVKVDESVVLELLGPVDMQRWSALEIRVPPGGKVLELEAEDSSTAWGGWIAVGEFHAFCSDDCRVTQCPETVDRSKVVAGLSGGVVDNVKEEGGKLRINGWAGDVKARESVEHVLAVLENGQVLACITPDQPRPDVAQNTGISALGASGFSLTVTATDKKSVTLYSIQSDGTLARLSGH